MDTNVKLIVLHTERNFPIRIEFVNTFENTRNGFNHKSEMRYWNTETFGNMYWTEKVHYINRTWEKYQYRTAMIKTVDRAMKFYKRVKLREKFLGEFGYANLRGHDKQFEKWCEGNLTLKDLQAAKDNL